MKIVNGQLIDKGVEVKPEFGNPEHIKALKNRLGESFYKSRNFNKSTEDIEEEFEGEMKMEIDEKCIYTFSMKFVCPKCGVKNTIECDDTFEDWEPDNSDVEELLGDEVECEDCNHKFSYEQDSNSFGTNYIIKSL